jgi:NADH-quinone oxidoreductase subunit J
MWLAGSVAGGTLMLVLVASLRTSELLTIQKVSEGGETGLIKTLGSVLFKDYVLPFEVSSILFLSAMVGAVVIGKKGD